MFTENDFYVEFNDTDQLGLELSQLVNTFDTQVSSNEGIQLDPELRQSEGVFDTDISDKITVVPSSMDHATAKNRDLPNQHPISAITNLNGELENRVETKSIIPDSYIDNL